MVVFILRTVSLSIQSFLDLMLASDWKTFLRIKTTIWIKALESSILSLHATEIRLSSGHVGLLGWCATLPFYAKR